MTRGNFAIRSTLQWRSQRCQKSLLPLTSQRLKAKNVFRDWELEAFRRQKITYFLIIVALAMKEKREEMAIILPADRNLCKPRPSLSILSGTAGSMKRSRTNEKSHLEFFKETSTKFVSAVGTPAFSQIFSSWFARSIAFFSNASKSAFGSMAEAN